MAARLVGGVDRVFSASASARERVPDASSSAWCWMSEAVVSAASTIERTWSAAEEASEAVLGRVGPAQLVQVLGDASQMGIHGLGLVATAADGEVSSFDVLTVQGQGRSSRVSSDRRLA